MFIANSLDSSLAPALIGAGSALVITVVAAIFGYWRYVRERTNQQNILVNALFGELANIYEHYFYAASELPKDKSDGKLKLRLQWSIYKELRYTKEISEYGFLSAGGIRLLMQLEMRVQNNNQFLEMLLADTQSIQDEDLNYAQERMNYAIATAREMINRLATSRPRLNSILKVIEKELPRHDGH